MDVSDILGSIIHEIFINAAADEFLSLIKRMLSGEGLDSVLQGGGDAAFGMTHALNQVGVDPSTLSDEDWTTLASILTT